MAWEVKAIPELNGYTVEWAEPNNYYLSRKNMIFHTNDLTKPFEKIAKIDAPFWRETTSNIRLAQRLLRFSITNILLLGENEIFISFDKSVGVIRNGEYKTLSGLKRPCRIMRSACAVDKNGKVYFGEYLANKERVEMHIYQFEKGTDVIEPVYTFPANSIKHIHGLYYDEYSDSMFCLTGDRAEECQILRSTDGCQTFNIIGQGDESWRAMSILFDKDYFYYGTDAEFLDNYIYQVNRKTLERKRLGEVNGTVFYSKKMGNELFFTTTAENSPSQKENAAAIWHLSENLDLKKIVSFEKDRWHSTLFQFGTIHFPILQNIESELYFYLVGVKGDNCTYRLVKQ